MRSTCCTSLGGSKGNSMGLVMPFPNSMCSASAVPSSIPWHVGVRSHVRATTNCALNDASSIQNSAKSDGSKFAGEQTSTSRIIQSPASAYSSSSSSSSNNNAYSRGTRSSSSSSSDQGGRGTVRDDNGGRAKSNWSKKQQQQQQRRSQHAGASHLQQHSAQQQRGQQQPWRQQPQQSVLLFQGGSSSSGSSGGTGASAAAPNPQALAALLTSKISRSEDLQQLHQVLLLHKTALGPVQLSAAISRAAKLHPNQLTERQQQWQQQQWQQQHVQQLRQLVDWLLQRFLSVMNEASFLEVSCMIGGLARLGYNTRNDVIFACLDATRHAMWGESVENKQLLQLGWGLARLGLKPDDDWLQGFEAETYRRLPTLNNIETANALWVFAKWGAKPSEAWLSAFLAHLPSQLLCMQPPELCSVVWGAAMLQLQLPVPVLDGLLLETQVKFGGFTGQGFGTLAWSLARMDIRPKRLWLQDFVRHSAAVLPGLSPTATQQQQQQQQLPLQQRDQVFTNIIWALGCWEHTPPQSWLQDFCRYVVPQLPVMTPQGLTIIAVGLAELNHKPPQPFTCYLLELFHQQLPAATAAHAAAFIWALPRLLLPRTHSQSVSAAAAAGSGVFQQQQQQQQQQGASFNAVAWLRQYCWLLQDIADHILPGLEKLFSTELVDAVCGFGDLGFFPGVAWMDAHEVNLNRHLDQLSTIQINLVKQAYVRLEQQQLQQQRLLHPEQLQLLRQQQQQQVAAAAAAAGSSGVMIGAGGGWQKGRLAASAAAAAAATAAEVAGTSAAAATTSPGHTDMKHSSSEGQRGSRNRRFEPPAWSRDSFHDNATTRGRGHSSSSSRRGRGRGRGRDRHGWDEQSDEDEVSINEEPLELPKLPKRPRGARIRLQKIREAEREQQQQELEDWRQRWQQQPRSQRWRVAKPGEYEGR